MPKAKPDKVIVHRIELQGKEREILEAYAGAQAVKAIALPAVGAGALYVGYKAARAAYGWTEDAVDDFKRGFQERATNAGVDGVETVFSLFTGYGWLWGKDD
jgi:hypothetical protein